jgi:hypothetical protein
MSRIKGIWYGRAMVGQFNIILQLQLEMDERDKMGDWGASSVGKNWDCS